MTERSAFARAPVGRTPWAIGEPVTASVTVTLAVLAAEVVSKVWELC
jgi:hypothetical protein